MVDKILKCIGRVAPLPSNIRRIMSIVNDAEADMPQLAGIVEEDPSLTLQALNLCNSAYYSLPIQVTSVAHAVRYLGVETVGGLALAAYFRGLMQGGKNKTNPWLRGAESHLLLTGQIAEKFARSAGGLASPSTVFTAGLLHDVGRLVFSGLDDSLAQKINERLQESEMIRVDAEEEILGMDHAEAGARLAERWKLPEIIVEAIRSHHAPFSTESLPTGYVFLANEMFYFIKKSQNTAEFLKRPGVRSVMDATGLSESLVQEAIDAFGP